MRTRKEFDSIGGLEIPAKAYYGVQTLRATKNFNITGRRMLPNFIVNLAKIKKAAAILNQEIDELDLNRSNAIIKACDEIISGKLHDQFIVDPIQGGAGTSANMNANEVIANRAIEILGGNFGDYAIIHPNDHVNMSQSTNDVFPTAGKLTILTLLPILDFELKRLYDALLAKSDEFKDILKMGRTQLQDAVPIRLGQEFSAYASVIARDIKRIENASKELKYINLGGTAIGTSICASPKFVDHIAEKLSSITGFELLKSENLIDSTQNLDSFVTISSAIKTCAINLSKIANDLRLLSSGPNTGIGEINLPAMQNGSSIMPGKVNPVIPEVVSQIAFNIIGNDITITMAAEAGQLELNAFEPILFYNIFESIETLTNGVKTFIDNCITGITANGERCLDLLNSSTYMATALGPYLGYKKSSELAKKSLETGVPIKNIILKEQLVSPATLDTLLKSAI